MFQNNPIDYNIKVKSKYVSILCLSKEDFIKLSISYKEEIEDFLNKSIKNYMLIKKEKDIREEEEKELNLLKIKSFNDKVNKSNDNSFNVSENFDENEEKNIKHNSLISNMNKIELSNDNFYNELIEYEMIIDKYRVLDSCYSFMNTIKGIIIEIKENYKKNDIAFLNSNLKKIKEIQTNSLIQ